MIISDREIIIVEYSTGTNWIEKLPHTNWLCVLVNNEKPRRYLDEVIKKIIDNNVCYVCTVGLSCELTHDLIDEEIVFREVDSEKLYLPNHLIVTTWHTDFAEGISFAILNAQHGEVEIKKVVILDMTDGKELNRINNLLTILK